jgi:hypothetical protein
MGPRSRAGLDRASIWSDERFPLYVYCVSRSHVPATVRAFIDFIVDSLGAKDSGALEDADGRDKPGHDDKTPGKTSIEAVRVPI